MTTFKQCRECAQVVEWAPEQDRRVGQALIVALTCEGGNAPHLCPRRRLVDQHGNAYPWDREALTPWKPVEGKDAFPIHFPPLGDG